MLIHAKDLEKYRNPDRRCTYPFTPDPVGYCWSYACHVDGESRFEDMLKICAGCECWKDDADTRQ